MRTYELEFLPSARKEWDKLGSSVRDQFRKKLAEVERTARAQSAAPRRARLLQDQAARAGYRLVYRVDDGRVVVVVVAVGKRERNTVYKIAAGRV